MSRYIDAEWLKELYKPYESYNGKELAVPIGAILANIDDAPTIDIVFCKECKYKDNCEQEVLLSEMYGEIEDTAHITYCSYGERREQC